MNIITGLAVTITGNLSTDLIKWLERKTGNTALVRNIKKSLNPEQLHLGAKKIIEQALSDTIQELEMDEDRLSQWKNVLVHPENRLQIIGWVFDWEESPKPELGEWSLENAPNQKKLNELLISIHDKIQNSKNNQFTLEFHNLISRMLKCHNQLSQDHGEIKQGIKRIEELLLSRENQDNISKSFENNYLDYLYETYSRLRMIGVREMRDVKQKLSLAYVSLRIQSREGENADALSQPAETVLVNHDLLTIRGSAGSGKTTLLHWIITQCSHPDFRFLPNEEKDAVHVKEDFPYGKFNSWMGLVPFFIPLRRIGKECKGRPDFMKFVSYLDEETSFGETPPNRWINDILLRQRRGIFLIDGVDELPMTDRYNFWQWLRDFLERYKGNRIVLTSRYFPKQVDKEKEDQKKKQEPLWDPPREFHNAELEDMNEADIREFIKKWHDAVLEYEDDTQRIAELKRRKEELPVKLLEDPSNRRVLELSRIPLLCALVCVLHWKEEGYLPGKRVDLYERCCQMLIDERDKKRNLLPPDPPLCHLTGIDKEMILQRLALDMLRNKTVNGEDKFLTEVSRKDAISWIKPNIQSVKDIQARKCRAGNVLSLLILRTSLLREPSGGRVDFTHRTFQEYLAACAAGAGVEGEEEASGGFCNELVNHANDDAWRQTIILAAGTNTGGQPFGRRLVRTLFKQGESFYRKQITRNEALSCFALSVACLETFKGPDPELRARIVSKLGLITPPQDFEQAVALSAAGDALVCHLKYEKIKDQDEGVVRACVKALSLVESKSALEELKRNYSKDKREAVLSDICAAPGIDPLDLPVVIQYIKEKGTPPDFAGKYLRDIFPLSKLTELRFLGLRHCGKIEDISPIAGLKKLEKIDLGYCTAIGDFSPLNDLPNLKTLDIQGIEIPKDFKLPKSIPSEPIQEIDFLEITDDLYMKMVWIEGGDFLMGSPEGEEGRTEREGPVHRVHLDGFWMASVPVTQRNYESIIGENPSYYKGAHNPVEYVSWDDAMKFCEKLSEKSGRDYSLPTEAQWEFACRAGSDSRFCFGDMDRELEHYAWYDKNSGSGTHPVGQKRPNAWGVFDMHGNVWEWCRDRYGEYKDGEFRNPMGPKKGEFRMLRGGSWLYGSRYCRSADRGHSTPGSRDSRLGFRVVLVLRT